MAPKKGNTRTGQMAGARLAYDGTKDSRKKPGAAASRAKGVTTKKGMARKGKVAGSRLAFDDTALEKHMAMLKRKGMSAGDLRKHKAKMKTRMMRGMSVRQAHSDIA